MPNLSLIGPSFSFGQAKQFPVSVTMIKPHPLLHPHMVNNAHSVTWNTYQISARFMVLLLAFGSPN